MTYANVKIVGIFGPMTKGSITFLLIWLMASCHQPELDNQHLQAQVDSLQLQLANSYKPGLGEFMSGIQVHHAKLWFAGQAGNWGLADFETREIREAIDDIKAYCKDRPEVVSIPMILPPLDSLDKAIGNRSLPQFRSGFILLTNTCNNCHHATKHEFNVIRIPTTPPLTNQVYEPGKN